MKRISKRLVAMMMALLVMLSVGSALAQPADTNVEEQGALNKFWKITKTVLKVVGTGLLMEEDAAQDEAEEQGFIRNALRKVGQFSKSAVNKVKDFAVDSYNKVKDVTVTSYTVIKDGAESAFDKTMDAVVGAYDKARDAVVGAAGAVKDTATDAVNRAKDAYVNTYKDAVGFTKKAWDTVSKGTKDIVNKVFEEEDGLVAGALESVTGTEVTGDLEEQGIIGNIFKGLKDGINTLNPFSP